MGVKVSRSRESGGVEVFNPDGAGACVLVCEHASNAIPSEFGNLGLDQLSLESHIAYDIGALHVAKALAASLDSPLVWSKVSRLIVNCNRSVDAHDLIPINSEDRVIPGNNVLSADDRLARFEKYYLPFHNEMEQLLSKRSDAGMKTALVTIHSFTPVFMGEQRHLDLGVLHDDDSRLADGILAAASRVSDLVVKRNEPYAPKDGVTFTLQRHGSSRGLLNVMLEIRNALIEEPIGQARMAAQLDSYIRSALGLSTAGEDPHAHRAG